MILNRDDPAVPALKELGEPLFLMDANPTAENIARLIYEHTAAAGFPVVEVRLWKRRVVSRRTASEKSVRNGS